MNKVIDMHAHFFPEEVPDFAAEFGSSGWPSVEHVSSESANIMIDGKLFRPITYACWNSRKRLRDMDELGIDIQIICATPVLFAYHRPVEQALTLAKWLNDKAIEICQPEPARLKALCQVPLQDIGAACEEVSRCMQNGHVGVQIGNHVGLKNLDDEGIERFLHHCADIGAPVLVHPWDMMAPERMPNYMLPWLVAMPAETQLSILSLILSGGFERLPRSLKICFAHGGGSFPYLLGRVDNAWKHRDIVRKDCPHLPSSYVDRFYVDSAVFHSDALSLLVKTMGSERVMLGSDYPFPLGEQVIGELVKTHPELSEPVKSRILANNAAEFFNL
ncbi:Aminocarboxymuconate-semialdehyde decarboxylase [Saliniradius amylolyticus]|uniref:2-amino-3-carboxymuconate-6-semialdehyde decarboxylase n=1 Tax=Saliniradius amylolyticus TaxID=2183582 RepID=A0A2S2E692_9ALTE|nr:amidohydrolase family protein [Saliniradius amylolyticus]AWL13185.1 Aminocarboxymuconate-semialdehyde decarboxylase [Saliniradius amylolyticus]